MRPPQRLGHYVSVCPVPDHRSIMEGKSKLKIMQEAHDTGDS